MKYLPLLLFALLTSCTNYMVSTDNDIVINETQDGKVYRSLSFGIIPEEKENSEILTYAKWAQHFEHGQVKNQKRLIRVVGNWKKITSYHPQAQHDYNALECQRLAFALYKKLGLEDWSSSYNYTLMLHDETYQTAMNLSHQINKIPAEKFEDYRIVYPIKKHNNCTIS